MYNLYQKWNSFTFQTDHELQQIYSGKHIVPFKTNNIETFTYQINTRIKINDSEENSTKSYTMASLNLITLKKY